MIELILNIPYQYWIINLKSWNTLKVNKELITSCYNLLMLRIKRVYDGYEESDGYRILIDRLWPRGVSKSDAHIDLWLKEIAPSTELRTWFGHDPKKWQDFRKKYEMELAANQESVEQMEKIMKEHDNVTLVYAAKDEVHNDAVVLLDYFR